MEVGMWMAREPWTVEPDARISEAARVMSVRRVRRLPVTAAGSRGARLVGILSTHDVWHACPAGRHPLSVVDWPSESDVPVHSVMTRDVLTVAPTTPIETAASLLRKHRIGALPVLDDGRLVGIVTESDLLDVLLQAIGVGERGMRVSLELDADDADDPVRAMVDLAARHGASIASVLALRRPDPATGAARRFAVVRLAGRETPELLAELSAVGARVRRISAAR
jgi:acetoin utilization protein AcuB